MSRTPDIATLADGVLRGDRAALARGITLVESTNPSHRALADELLERVLPQSGGAHRVGISGVPGVGKSTFIEALGTRLLDRGHRLAVLAVDPTSARTRGSILGDKTRMAELAADARAYIRPSPAGGSLGGVARRTREAIVLCEASGFDVVFVETVGVGQSETAVAGMVDTFLLLMLPGAGDELQGIKRGIMELAEIVAVNKADGDRVQAARLARRQVAGALHTLAPASPHWTPRALTCSAVTGEGLDEVWESIAAHRDALDEAGELAERRAAQALAWFETLVDEGLHELLHDVPAVRQALKDAREAVRASRRVAGAAAEDVLRAVGRLLQAPG